MSITDEDRLNLKKLVDKSDCEDNTDGIRKLRHSGLIRDDVRTLENLKKARGLSMNDADFLDMCASRCRFLYDNYTDIFHKIINNELDLMIMTKFLTVLKLIEDGKVDQHEGSVVVGKILKELYLDSAVKRADAIDKKYESEKVPTVEPTKISWREYRNVHL
jgi:hypothetical protein